VAAGRLPEKALDHIIFRAAHSVVQVMKRSWTTDRHRIETLKGHFGGKNLAEITPDLTDATSTAGVSNEKPEGRVTPRFLSAKNGGRCWT
jgi:hypothetical protein